MHDTDATTITSSRETSLLVADSRNRSMCSLMRGVFLDVDVALRDIGFGLVVVVIADEVADGVVGEEALELLVQLSRERLVVGEDQRRLVEGGDDMRGGHSLAGAGRAEQRLEALAGSIALDQFGNRFGLIACRFEFAGELKLGGHDWTRMATRR